MMIGPVRPAVDTTGFTLKKLNGIANLPGDPGYLDKIPPAADLGDAPPLPRGTLIPTYAGDEVFAADGHDCSAVLIAPRPQHRVAIYSGRAENSFNVIVESAPDWDTLTQRRCTVEEVDLLLGFLDTLGIKTVDKTGGDLDEAIEYVRARNATPTPINANSKGRQPASPRRRKAGGGDSATPPA